MPCFKRAKMPPKGKQLQEKKKKTVDDKTFGLKNKNKSAKVQKFVQQVKQQVDMMGMDREEYNALKKAKEEKKRLEEEAKEKERMKQSVYVGPKQTLGDGVDPKTVLCQYFRVGACQRGAKCKFSHDLNMERKVAKINVYEDPRLKDTMDSWDQAKLEEVVNQKTKGRMPATDIICKYFLDAVEQQKYGWFWECQNGVTCHYKHCLPPGYVLKSQIKKTDTEEVDVCELIEAERKLLDISKCTPVTLETFKIWKDKKLKEKADREAAEEKERVKAASSKKVGVMSGRALFAFDHTLFQDDEAAANDEDYELQDEIEAGDLGQGLTALDEQEAEAGEEGDEEDEQQNEENEEEKKMEGWNEEKKEKKSKKEKTELHHQDVNEVSEELKAERDEHSKKEKKDKKEKKEKKEKKDKKEHKHHKHEDGEEKKDDITVAALNEDLFLEDVDLPDDA